MDAIYKGLTRAISAVILLLAVPQLAARLALFLHSSDPIRMENLVSCLGGLVAAALLAGVAFGPARPLSLWTRLAGVAAFTYFGLPLLGVGVASLTIPKDFTYWPPMVLLAAVILAWGAFTAMGDVDAERLRRWIVQVLFGTISTCVAIDLAHWTFGGASNFTPLQLIPHVALAVAISIQRHNGEALPLLLLRWSMGYLLVLVCVLALDGAAGGFRNPGLIGERALWALFLTAVSVVTGWLAWRTFIANDWRRHLAIFGAATPTG